MQLSETNVGDLEFFPVIIPQSTFAKIKISNISCFQKDNAWLWQKHATIRAFDYTDACKSKSM